MSLSYSSYPPLETDAPPGLERQRLPIANVAAIMKLALPKEAKLSKDVKETMVEVVEEFILFITGEAAEKCNEDKRKTINGQDLIGACDQLGLENYAEVMRKVLKQIKDDKQAEGGSDEGANSNRVSQRQD